MPIYEYRCQACSTVYEERRPFSQSNAPSQCPQCQEAQGKRLLSTFIALNKDRAGLALSGGGCACSTGGGCACRG